MCDSQARVAKLKWILNNWLLLSILPDTNEQLMTIQATVLMQANGLSVSVRVCKHR